MTNETKLIPIRESEVDGLKHVSQQEHIRHGHQVVLTFDTEEQADTAARAFSKDTP